MVRNNLFIEMKDDDQLLCRRVEHLNYDYVRQDYVRQEFLAAGVNVSSEEPLSRSQSSHLAAMLSTKSWTVDCTNIIIESGVKIKQLDSELNMLYLGKQKLKLRLLLGGKPPQATHQGRSNLDTAQARRQAFQQIEHDIDQRLRDREEAERAIAQINHYRGRMLAALEEMSNLNTTIPPKPTDPFSRE